MDSEPLHIAASIWNLAGVPRLITLDNSPDQQYASVESLLPRGNPDAEHLRFETEISLVDYDAPQTVLIDRQERPSSCFLVMI